MSVSGELLLLLLVVGLVQAAPDPGHWTFNNLTSEQNYIGTVFCSRDCSWFKRADVWKPSQKIIPLPPPPLLDNTYSPRTLFPSFIAFVCFTRLLSIFC